MSSARIRVWLVILSIGVLPRTARGQVFDSSYNLEVYQGPLMAHASALGMGGARIAVAEGSGDQLLNPAAISNRLHHNRHDWFDWDFNIDFLLAGAGGSDIDLDNNGRSLATVSGSVLATAGAMLQFGRFGIGVAASGQLYDFTTPLADGSDAAVRVETVMGSLSLGYAFFDGALATGVSIVGPNTRFELRSGEVRQQGAAIRTGVVWRPQAWPWRIGCSFFAPTGSTDQDAEGELGDELPLLFPAATRVPWELGLGVAVSFGPRTWNPRPTYGGLGSGATEEEPRRYVIVALDAMLIGPTERAVGIESWIEQTVQRAGRRLDLGIRAGAESEVWHQRLRVRAGTYYEPSRFDDVRGRFHGTAGFDLRLGELGWDWRLTGAVDVARAYLNWTVSIGLWH